MKKIIFWLFAVLIFFVPIVLWPYTSEVFEFNKIVLVYALTTVIVGTWIIRSIVERKIIFRRTTLDIPLLIFFGSQLISTILSIDFYTSVFGYYSRFNGGLLSTISYLLLYWAFVSNFDVKDAVNLIKIWFTSAVLVCLYGVLEHFGIDKNVWVQDVQSRVFSSLGQPNWLAAWVVALIPIAWAFALESGISNQESGKNSGFKILNSKFLFFIPLSILFFWTLIFTKSRSGFLGFGIATIIFWGAYVLKNIKKVTVVIPPLLIVGATFVSVCLISGMQWTPNLNEIISKSANRQITVPTGDTALETGGTESGVIREIVWTGALKVWQHYPIFGTGVETFAYSYYMYRPAAHNLTSEWDFIYNKAHNEFLNMAANSGTVGLISYLILIGFSIYVIIKNTSIQEPNHKQITSDNLKFGILAGYISLSVSNFFGFSVVPTQLQFFLFPAFAIAIAVQSAENKVQSKKIENIQKFFIAFVLCTMFYLLFAVGKYWYSDTLYARGKSLNSVPRPDLAIPVLTQAIKLEPGNAIYDGEIANSYATVAMAYNQAKDASSASQFTDYAVSAIQNAVAISPANVNLRRTLFGVYVRLSTVDEKYLKIARDSLTETIKLAPTDAKLYYNLGIADANLGDYKTADADFAKAIELKANYGDARIQYAALLVHEGKNAEAKNQLNYVLTKIDPNNQTAKQALANIK